MMHIKKMICWLAMLCLMATHAQGQLSGGRSTKNRFFLLSAYTPEDRAINSELFAQTLNEITKRGVRVYRNGQTYHVLVPWKALYISGTDNLVKDGQQLVNGLSQFLSFYQIEYMRLTGFYQESSQNAGDDKKTLPKDLVAQTQAARLVAAMRSNNPQVARVGISVSEKIIRSPSFIQQQYDAPIPTVADPAAWLTTAKTQIVGGKDDSKSPTIFDDGGVIIEFKKY